jgi:predicted metal-dependent hydrolase
MQPPLPFDAVRPEPARIQTPPEFVRHPRARRYIVRVRPDGSVRVSIPRWGSKREALAFAERQQAWIDKQRARIAAEQLLQRDVLSPDEIRAFRKRAARELPARLWRSLPSTASPSRASAFAINDGAGDRARGWATSV